MSTHRIGDWHRAIAEHIPVEIGTLLDEIADLDRKKVDKLALIQDYREMLLIAQRRVPVPGTLQPERPAEALFVAA